MTRNSLSICALATTALLSACGGGGGGGGGGSSVSLDTPASITGANFSEIASLVVSSNLLVADSPNYNEGYPAAVIGGPQPTTVNVMNLSRMQLAEVKKVTPAEVTGPELPIGVRPVADEVDTPCSGGGTKTKRYTNAAGGPDTDLDPVTGDKLVITYSNCNLDLQQEANNCLTVLEPNKVVTLNGAVTTDITAVTSVSVYSAKLTYSSLRVAATRNGGPVSSTVNGSITIALADSSPQITLTTPGSDTLNSFTDGVTDRLSEALIQYDDNQQGCTAAVPNNNYTILSTTRGKVARSTIGYVRATVTSPLVGNSQTGDNGFPAAGGVQVNSDDGTSMTINTLNPSGEVQVTINGRALTCATQNPKWSDVFVGTLNQFCQ